MKNVKNHQSEFSFFDNGKSRRDDGIKKITFNNAEWMAAAILLLHQLPSGWRGLPEDWRFAMLDTIGPPTNPHAWGALTLKAKKRGLIRPTGNRLKMRARKSNARMTDEYERP